MAIGISQPTSFLLSKARFQRNYNWDVALPDIGITPQGILEGIVGLAIGQLVRSVEFGDYNIGSPITMKVGPYEAHFAGLLTVEKVKMSFLKTTPDAVAPYFNAWKKLIVDDSGLYHPKSNYQKDIYIRFIDTTGIAIGRYRLIGAFPTTFPSYSLNYERDELTKIDVQFTVDKIEYEAF